MPYKTEWIDPELFLEHEGVKIFHTYKDCDWANHILTYWYTTNEDDSNEVCQFDVRGIRLHVFDPMTAPDSEITTIPLNKIPAYREMKATSARDENDIIAEIVRKAIEQGLLKQNQPIDNGDE